MSCMGTGNKLNPTKFEVTDIYKTSVCPLAKVMRKELRTRGIKKLKVVYSKEEPIKPNENCENSCKNNCICPPGTKKKMHNKKTSTRKYIICAICCWTNNCWRSNKRYIKKIIKIL